ncbi:MBOAT family O-acyltransferase [Tissierella sp. Yu-01]|uniref:MBOAT family O-acyltransferase n=1 Tax=Tissierella sp. Yu-01 TaxID=3035694 RepID=UPI00240D5EA2|nr:MBOAT family O-acyltransferase [Tissierella sp. Yu-01]WFA07775.1 MBOAT family O-acyltransferase [Tissierella sp. Yu-01]
MVFSSVLFLFYFLPLVLIIYFISPNRYRNFILFVSSLFFYGWGETRYIWLMLFSTVLDYICGMKIHIYKLQNNKSKAKLWLLTSVFINLGLLSFFKYADFIILNLNTLLDSSIPILNLPLPIGISFYTFQTMSYSIDIYRGEAEVQEDIISFGSYVTLFPQLIAGPIVRYQTIAEELKERTITTEKFTYGITRFIIGLGKKVLIANNVGLIWEGISKIEIDTLSVASAWIGIIAYAFQIYFDFSAYSDMAIGLGKVFGFNFLENFNYPYMSTSITEFWRRWHISLGTWFKEYVYIPLGGNKKGQGKQLRNIIIVWLLTGIWHGASWNFVIWGLFFGVILILEKTFLLRILEKLPAGFNRIYTIVLVLLSWAIFAQNNINDGLSYIRAMFDFGNVIINDTTIYTLYTNIFLLSIAAIGASDFPKMLWQKYNSKFKGIWIIENIYIVIILLLTTAYLVDQSYNPFLYLRF